jgi:hypothetical protein
MYAFALLLLAPWFAVALGPSLIVLGLCVPVMLLCMLVKGPHRGPPPAQPLARESISAAAGRLAHAH